MASSVLVVTLFTVYFYRILNDMDRYFSFDIQLHTLVCVAESNFYGFKKNARFMKRYHGTLLKRERERERPKDRGLVLLK